MRRKVLVKLIGGDDVGCGVDLVQVHLRGESRVMEGALFGRKRSANRGGVLGGRLARPAFHQ
ncbi:hypothetical protein PAMC26510_14090 [Caballeronia sordidicola]|uniref:Uncharacterized protein n=1 Tax=Caballeronia sordidicola TaxID=196367 RepID=A0A242MVV0_CABSO|nr:hypothetical protein PAMC26510_14090 [Caballeronia sordidicola]